MGRGRQGCKVRGEGFHRRRVWAEEGGSVSDFIQPRCSSAATRASVFEALPVSGTLRWESEATPERLLAFRVPWNTAGSPDPNLQECVGYGRLWLQFPRRRFGDAVNRLQGWLLLLSAAGSTQEPPEGPLAERWSMAECMTDSHTSSMFGITKIFYSGKREGLEYQALPGTPADELWSPTSPTWNSCSSFLSIQSVT